jgi:hypothetical protein
MTENQTKSKITQSKQPIKIITVSHYCGTKKMNDIFENIITEQIRKNLEKIS